MSKKINDVLSEIKKFWKGPDDFVKVYLAGLFSRSKILLLSSHGKGKSHLTEISAKVLNTKKSRVQGSVGLQQNKFLGRYDIPHLMKGEEHIVWNEFIEAPIKFFDEINRVTPPVLSDLFSMLAENEAYFGSASRKLDDFTFIATMNPADEGTFQLPPPLMDRFDLCMVVPTSTVLSKLDIIAAQNLEPKPILKENGLMEIWDEVEKVKVSEEAQFFAASYVRSLQLCQQGEKESLVNFPNCCEKCDIKNGSIPCSRINGQVSDRAVLSMLRVAKGLAYLEGKGCVDIMDLHKKILPHMIRHRIEFLPTYMNDFSSMTEAITKLNNEVYAYVQDSNRFRELINKVRAGKKKPADILPYQKSNNLLIKEMCADVEEELLARAKQERAALLSGISNLSAQELLELKKTEKDPEVLEAVSRQIAIISTVFFKIDETATVHLKRTGIKDAHIDQLMVDSDGKITEKNSYSIEWTMGTATIKYKDVVRAYEFHEALKTHALELLASAPVPDYEPPF